MHRQTCPAWTLRPSYRFRWLRFFAPRARLAAVSRLAVALIAGTLILLFSQISARADWPSPAHQKPVVTIVPPVGTPPPPVYGFPTPSYRFGWWNTNYWSRKTFHHGFYGDYWQWGYQPGY
jgi:hypothetical protein